MDQGEGQEHNLSGAAGVASEASARVGRILEEAEDHGRAAVDEAEQAAAETRRSAEVEAGRIAAEAREAARAAARERAQKLAELQAALTSRGPAVVDGLEGAGLTRARLEALIEALAASAERVLAEAEAGELSVPSEVSDAADGSTAAGEEADSQQSADSQESGDSQESADPEEPAASAEDPVAAAENRAQPVPDEAPATEAPGPIPEGAPLARKPVRSRERDARFAALLLAVQGRERGDVKAHLRSEYGFADCDPILDEVFGRTPA
jgi:hypothetical protein